MRRLTRVLCVAAVLAATSACGRSTATEGTQVTPTTLTTQGQTAVFPVNITRMGGIAGFRDVLVVGGDGLVSVTQKGQQRKCRLTPQAVERLRKAASGVPWPRITPASTVPSFPDDLVTTVQTPAGGPVRVEGPQVGEGGKVFRELLNDVTGKPAGPRLCMPV